MRALFGQLRWGDSEGGNEQCHVSPRLLCYWLKCSRAAHSEGVAHSRMRSACCIQPTQVGGIPRVEENVSRESKSAVRLVETLWPRPWRGVVSRAHAQSGFSVAASSGVSGKQAFPSEPETSPAASPPPGRRRRRSFFPWRRARCWLLSPGRPGRLPSEEGAAPGPEPDGRAGHAGPARVRRRRARRGRGRQDGVALGGSRRRRGPGGRRRLR